MFLSIDKNMFPIRSLIIIAGLCLLSGGAGAQVGEGPRGPMHISGQTPLQTRKLDMVPTRPGILREGEWNIALFSGLANRWNNTQNYLIDCEVFQNQFEIGLGVGGNTEIGLEIPVLTRSGGCLDQLIVDFHRMFDLGQAGRTEYPNDQLRMSYINSEGKRVIVLDNDDRKTALGDISFLTRTQVFSGKGRLSPVLFTALLRFPTTSDRDFYGSSGIDGAFGLSSSYQIHPFYIYGTIGYGIYGSGKQYGIALRPYQWTFFGALEWVTGKSSSLVLQQLVNSGMAEDFYDFSRPTYEVTLGLKKNLSQHLMLEFGLLENVFIFDNSIDFGISSALTYHP